jgi:UDP-2,3-diacylglucosamine pyrophosphatase LpxH
MRTLIVSDLHLGNGGGFDVFAGGEALPALLDRFSSTPARVILNGDTVDFLMNEDPLELDAARAREQARAISRDPASAAVLAALGRVLAAGGEVIVRLGNHDVELALPEVQEVFRGALGQPAEVARRLVFETGEAPSVIDVGGAKILVTHGEHNDPWNFVDYGRLGKDPSFEYAPGSRLVKQLMNPLKRAYGMRFADLLKPDFQGAVLTALAVDPTAVKLLFKKTTASMLWPLFRKMQGPLPIAGEEEKDLGLADRVKQAGLTEEEQAVLEEALGDAPVAFSEEDEGVLSSARRKLAQAGLATYAKLQRRLAGDIGLAYFDLTPDEAEWAEAKRLAAKYGARAVIIGHTHAARWKEAEGVVFANTGTWIWLMKLPEPEAVAEVWADFLDEIRKNPGLLPERSKLAKVTSRFTAALAEPAEGGGALLSLIEWDPASGVTTLGSARVPAG